MTDEVAPPPPERWTVLVSVAVPATIETIGLLARLQLDVRRLGGDIRVHDPSGDIEPLLELAGLCDTVPVVDRLGGGMGR